MLSVLSLSNATVSEQSASALQRLKTYLRRTMHQDRLTHSMVLYVSLHSRGEQLHYVLHKGSVVYYIQPDCTHL